MASIDTTSAFDVDDIRAEFPVLGREIRPGVRLIYLDSAATSQKPQRVIDAERHVYEQYNANIHRGIHHLAEEATAAYEAARDRIQAFIGAASRREIIFTRNTTESINLVAQSWGRANLKSGDTIILTEMEHHSNLVPWQMLASEIGFTIRFVPVDEQGLLDQESYRQFLDQNPKLVGLAHMSNMLGTINPVAEMASRAHQVGALVLLDAAQSVPHMPVDVQALDADFVAFSAHKMCGPTGIGILYGKEALLEAMPPFMGGGDMIRRVSLDTFSTNDLPYKFEAGTPAIAQAVGFGEAVAFLGSIGMQAIHAHEQSLTAYALERLEEVPFVKVYGPSVERKGGVMSFTFKDVHPHDIAQILDRNGIAVRAGHHCAMPIHEKYQIPASTRASFYLYNQKHEIDRMIEGLYEVREIFT